MALGQYLGGTALIIFGAFLLLIGIFMVKDITSISMTQIML